MVEVCQRGMLEVSFSGGRFVKNLNTFFGNSFSAKLIFWTPIFLPRIGCTPLPSSKPPTEPPRYVPMVTTFLRFIGAWITSACTNLVGCLLETARIVRRCAILWKSDTPPSAPMLLFDRSRLWMLLLITQHPSITWKAELNVIF